MRAFPGVVVLGVLASAGTASAQQTHQGVYVHGELGAAFSDHQNAGTEYTGWGPGMAVAVGGPIAENLVLHGDFLASWFENPTLTRGAVSMPTPAGITYDLTRVALGPGITWYLMPINVFASGAITFGKQFTDVGTTNPSGQTTTLSYHTNWGLGFELALGKEWWVGPRVGIGVVGRYSYGQMDDASTRNTTLYTVQVWSLSFSASYD
jgi:hypothetical protein